MGDCTGPSIWFSSVAALPSPELLEVEAGVEHGRGVDHAFLALDPERALQAVVAAAGEVVAARAGNGVVLGQEGVVEQLPAELHLGRIDVDHGRDRPYGLVGPGRRGQRRREGEGGGDEHRPRAPRAALSGAHATFPPASRAPRGLPGTRAPPPGHGAGHDEEQGWQGHQHRQPLGLGCDARAPLQTLAGGDVPHRLRERRTVAVALYQGHGEVAQTVDPGAPVVVLQHRAAVGREAQLRLD